MMAVMPMVTAAAQPAAMMPMMPAHDHDPFGDRMDNRDGWSLMRKDGDFGQRARGWPGKQGGQQDQEK